MAAPASEGPVRYASDGTLAILQMDDGKANALSHAMLAALDGALDRAQAEGVRGVVLSGRPGRFCAGFDLGVMQQGPDAAGALVARGVELAVRLFEWPGPVVIAATGHALAMGAVLLCTADERVGARGEFKIGLNEVAIGLPLPRFAIELAQARLSIRHVHRATALAEIYTPEDAVEAGYLDRAVDASKVEAEATTRGRALVSTLDAAAYRATKRALRGALGERLRDLKTLA